MNAKLLGILIIIFGTIIGAFAAYIIKIGANKRISLKKIIKNKHLLVGLIIYGISALIYIKGLSYIEVSIAYPLTSLTWVWSFILAVILLKEKIVLNKIIGLVLVIIGVYFVVI